MNIWHLYSAFMIGMLIGVGAGFADDYFDNKENETILVPCNCLSIKEVLLHVEKREMFVDKLQSCKKSERSAIIDSINYHNALLDSTGNKIEY